MKNIFRCLIILSVIFMISGCDKKHRDADKLELYILRHVADTGEFIKDEMPICTGNDIESYDWDTHTIIFTDEFLEDRNIIAEEDNESFLYGGSQILGVLYPDQFALYLDGEELYRGYMKPPLFLSFYPTGPMISDLEGGVVISNIGNGSDLRSNEELYDFLKDMNMLSK